MDLHQLQYVIAVAECKSVTKAARKLYISQPSLSYAISQIEKEVGLKLFERSHQPITLTEAGRLYVKTARSILRENTELYSRLADLKNSGSGRIHMGIPAERGGYMLPYILPEFRCKFPDSEILMKEAGTDDLIEMLKIDKVSFIVCPWNGEAPIKITKEKLYDEPVQLIAAENAFTEAMYLNKNKRIVNLKKIAALPYIGIKKRHSITKEVTYVFEKAQIIPHTILEVESSIAAAQLAAGGLGYTIVPGRCVKILGPEYQKYCYKYAENPLKLEISILYKEETYLNKAELYLIQLLRNKFKNTSLENI
jgi:DNA-binding transcriptional LysR family regulator